MKFSIKKKLTIIRALEASLKISRKLLTIRSDAAIKYNNRAVSRGGEIDLFLMLQRNAISALSKPHWRREILHQEW